MIGDVNALELGRLERELRAAPDAVRDELPAVVRKGAHNIKTEWRALAAESAGAHGKHYPRSIDYDDGPTLDGYGAEIGPRTDRPQGGMGVGFELGSVNQAPHLDYVTASQAEASRFEAALVDLMGRVL